MAVADPVLSMLRALGPAIIARENADFEKRWSAHISTEYAKIQMSDIVNALKADVEEDPYASYILHKIIIDIHKLFTIPFHYSFNGIRYSSESIVNVVKFIYYLSNVEPYVKSIVADLQNHFPGAYVAADIHIDPPGKDIRSAYIALTIHYEL